MISHLLSTRTTGSSPQTKFRPPTTGYLIFDVQADLVVEMPLAHMGMLDQTGNVAEHPAPCSPAPVLAWFHNHNEDDPTIATEASAKVYCRESAILLCHQPPSEHHTLSTGKRGLFDTFLDAIESGANTFRLILRYMLAECQHRLRVIANVGHQSAAIICIWLKCGIVIADLPHVDGGMQAKYNKGKPSYLKHPS